MEQGKISYENEKRKADEYNKALRFNITDDGFVSNNDNSVNNSDNDTDEDNNKDNEESSFDENSEYNKCLNLNNDGMMGYISIPKIDVKLPIYHSTDSEVLQKYMGHLEGSSLPGRERKYTWSFGGSQGSCPAPDCLRIWTELKGDRFYIYVLNQVLTYQVDRIYPMIDKNDKAKLTEALQTKEGEDYITLLTCTPYGVNTHRLLVGEKE
ncbi:MAG: sortase [Eubacterium sp.]